MKDKKHKHNWGKITWVRTTSEYKTKDCMCEQNKLIYTDYYLYQCIECKNIKLDK